MVLNKAIDEMSKEDMGPIDKKLTCNVSNNVQKSRISPLFFPEKAYKMICEM